MSWTLTSSEAIIRRAGASASSAATSSGAIMRGFADDAEDTFCTLTRRDWKASPPVASMSGAVITAVSGIAAMGIIEYDDNGWASIRAQTKLDLLRDEKDRIIKQLSEEQNQVFP